MMQVELQATCAALGYVDDNTYHKEPDCLETVKDLIRFLKREDESCDIRRQLGNAQILQNDLLNLIKHYHTDRILLETVVRLLVNLSQPAKLCFQNQIPADKTNRNFYLEIEGHLQSYKEAFADEALFAVLTKKLGELLQLDFENRQEEDRLLIERLLILMRNILHVPPNPTKEQRTDDDASMHDQVLWALHISGMEDLLLYLGSADNERQFALHVLEIISLMFREQTAEQLASAGGPRSATEREKDENELEIIREREKAQKKAVALKNSSRHSRFGGTFTVANMKSISEQDLIYHRPVANVKNMTFDHNKKMNRKPKNRRVQRDRDITRRSTLSIRLFLKEFCIQFLENCYNPLMYAVKDILVRARAQENDETYYLWAIRFFMQFNRHHKFSVDLVGETLSVQAFHYIQTNLQNFHEMLLGNKKEGIIWSRRMHLALKAYLELLHNLALMERSKDHKIQQSAKVLKGNVFYLMEYRDVFVMLLKKFDETRQSRVFLQDLVECTHLFIRMLEHYCKKNKHLIVQRHKKRIVHKKKAKKTAAPAGPSAEQLEDQWDTVSGDLSAIFQGRGTIPEDVVPFDAASEMEEAQQRVEVMIKIQAELRRGQGGQAVALLRTARSLWPEREEFGTVDIAPEDEFMAMREIFFANLPQSQVNPPPPAEEEEEEDEEDEVNDEETEGFYQNKEEEFNLMDFLKRFVSPQVLRAYITLLGEYSQLSAHTLHCTVKMLHRLAVDLCMTPMLFQARLFRIFQKVLTDPACHTKQYQELFGLAKYIVRKFFELAETNPKVYVELFFWKTNREAIEMTEGYGSIKENASKTKQIWTEEQDDELRQLYDQHKDAKLDGGDPVDNIMSELIDQTKTRRMIVKHLIALDLVGTARELKPLKSGNRAWREEEILELRELVDQYRESNDPMVNILSGLTTKRSKYKVMEKCVELNLVGNRKELHKNKAGGGGGSGRRKRRSLMSSSEDEMGDNDDNDEMGDNDDNNDMESEPEEKIWSDDDAPSGELGDSEGDDDTDEQPLYIMRIKQAVRHAIKKGLAEAALEWIRKCLSRTADDRDEDDDDESIPLVPLLDEQEEAMDNSAFRAILRAVGIKPPANEQEQFWRIPGNFNAADLRSRASVLVTPSAEELKKKPSGKYRALKDLAKIRKRKMDNIKKPEPKKPTKTAPEPEPEFKSREFLSSATESSDDDDNPRLRIVEGNEAVTAPVNRRTSNTDDTSSSSESEDDKNKSVRDKDDSSSDDDDDDDKSSSRKARSKRDKSDSSRDDDIQSSSSKARSKRDQSSSSSDDDVQSISSKARSKRDRSSSGSDGDRSSSSDDNDGDGGSSSDDNAAGGGTGRMDHSMIDEDSMSSHSKRSRRAMSEESDKSAQPSKRARVQPESEDERKTKNTEPGSFPATLLTQPIGSDDSDVDDHVPIKRGAKRPAIIDSDSD